MQSHIIDHGESPATRGSVSSEVVHGACYGVMLQHISLSATLAETTYPASDEHQVLKNHHQLLACIMIIAGLLLTEKLL